MQVVSENHTTLVFFTGDQEAARLVYKNRFSAKASIHLPDGRTSEVVLTDFWRSISEIRENGKTVLVFRRRWTGRTIIETPDSGSRYTYFFRQKGFFTHRYVLSDKDDRELAVARPQFQWKGFRYSFNLELSDSIRRRENYVLLAVLLVYLTRRAMSQHHSAAVA
ncbi:MAG: hypothetical protein JNL22_12590 [Bacteroidales bacterium]|nr:hypothetical protein [Bacteroidales bacterium]